MGSGYSKMKKQAKQLQNQFEEMQKNLKETKVTGSSGNGLVKVTLNGLKELLNIKIKPDCVDAEDLEGLEDLILAAHAHAMEQLDDEQAPNLPFHF